METRNRTPTNNLHEIMEIICELSQSKQDIDKITMVKLLRIQCLALDTLSQEITKERAKQ